MEKKGRKHLVGGAGELGGRGSLRHGVLRSEGGQLGNQLTLGDSAPQKKKYGLEGQWNKARGGGSARLSIKKRRLLGKRLCRRS